jgi:hypothetical protein
MSSRIDLFYGDPGTGKSRSILELIIQVFKATGKTARVYVGEGSGATYRDSGLVDAGIIALMDYSTRDYPLTVTQQITDGWWPADVDDPQSPLAPLSPTERTKTGLWIFEGISVMGLYMMGNRKGGLAWQAARGIKIGQDSPFMVQDADIDPAGRYILKSGTGEKFGGNPQSHYGMAQTNMLDRIERSKALPGWVIWTGHEVSAEDKKTGEKCIAPEMAGQAKSANLARTFNYTLHFTTALRDGGRTKVKDAHTGVDVKQAGREYRIYTQDHYDPDGATGLLYRAQVRAPMPETVQLYYAGGPGQGIVQLYQDVEKGKALLAAQVQAELTAGKEVA